MRNWEIRARGRNCSACEQPFETGQTYHTLLEFSGEECERRDHCSRCWKELAAAGPPPESAAYWQGRFRRLTPPPEKEKIRRDVIERLLTRYLDSDQPAHVNLCYILALLEERKKVFVPREEIRDGEGNKVIVYEHTDTGETYLIRDPRLSLAEIEEVQGQVRDLIEAEKLAREPGTEEKSETEE